MPSVATKIRGLGIILREAVTVAADRRRPHRGDVPLRIEALTPAALDRALQVPEGSVKSIEITDSNSGTAARARISITTVAGVDLPEQLFVKLTPTSYAQHLLMNVFGLGAREVEIYQTLGNQAPVQVPHCYAAVTDSATGRTLMAFEDLSGRATFRTVVDSVTPTEAEAITDSLADLHIAFWNSPRFDGDLKGLTGRSPAANALGDTIRRRLLGKLAGPAADLVPTRMQSEARMFFEQSELIDRFWAHQPQTLIHGDPHLGNLYFNETGPGFLDWQVAMTGSGLRDLAYFATAAVEPDQLRQIERALVDRYASKLAAAGIPSDPDHMWTLYRAGVTEFYVAAVATASSGESMQPYEISRVGVARAVAACAAHDSFALLRSLAIDA